MPNSAPTDQELTSAAGNGDRRAFDSLVARYHSPVLGYILSRIPGGRDDAEDLAQDTWIAVWNEMSKAAYEGGFDPAKGGFYTYVCNRFARFYALQYVQKSRRRTAVTMTDGEDGEDALSQIPDPDGGLGWEQTALITEELRILSAKNLSHIEAVIPATPTSPANSFS